MQRPCADVNSPYIRKCWTKHVSYIDRSSFISGELKSAGDSIYLCLTGELLWPPRMPPRTACLLIRILSTSLISVSIFSVCCYVTLGYLSRWKGRYSHASPTVYVVLAEISLNVVFVENEFTFSLFCLLWNINNWRKISLKGRCPLYLM